MGDTMQRIQLRLCEYERGNGCQNAHTFVFTIDGNDTFVCDDHLVVAAREFCTPDSFGRARPNEIYLLANPRD